MTLQREILLRQLHLPEPFPEQRQTMESQRHLYLKAIERAGGKHVQRVCEIGAWLGHGTVDLDNCLDELGVPDYCIISVDTWLGSVEHYFPPYRELLGLRCEGPTVYERWRERILDAKCRHTVLPVRLPSSAAAQLFKRCDVVFDLVCVDGSHDAEDVRRDLRDYWERLAPGGVICGDDWTWDSVREEVQAFAAGQKKKVEKVGGNCWIMENK